MKILIVGSGGREHALAWKLSQSPKVDKIYCAPGNPGIGEIAENIPIAVSELDKLTKFAKGKKIDLTFVGPEAPLIDGIVDLFRKNKLTIIGPTQKAAQIEGSKVFAKKLMLKYRIPTADFAVFDDYKYAVDYIKTARYPLVLKADGPALGKGVSICENYKEASKFVMELMQDKVFGKSGRQIIIEECLMGPEVSFMVATDGEEFVSFLSSQDHKRVFDGDKGPNTGGMGAYAPVPFADKKLIKLIENEIVVPTLKAMKKEGCPYQGILYPGLIISKDGPKVLEFNCRFGDPETQPLMSLLKTDLVDILLAIKNRTVKKIKLQWYKGSAVCVVLTSKGYPGIYDTGKKVHINKLLNNKNTHIFHSGTSKKNGQIITSGGRVLGITASGPDLKTTIKKAYKTIGKSGIYFSGMHYRKDIGAKGLS